VKGALFDDPEAVGRLAARFRHSQRFMQDDPWAKRAAGERGDLHRHLATVVPAATEYA
jgi:nitrite reductase (NADH) large subunit